MANIEDSASLKSFGIFYNPYGKLMEQQLSRFIQELPTNTYQTINQ